MKIGVIGANGQVGMEVSLFLQAMGTHVNAIVRSELAAALPRRLGLTCRVGSIGNRGEAQALLEGCDLVADFSLPGGLPSQARAAIRRNITNVLRFAPPGARYALASSTMAIGMRHDDDRYQVMNLSRTLYAKQKRHAERFAQLIGALRNRRVYVMRLGQVHGELQSVSRHLLSVVDGRPLALRHGGRSGTDTVFTATVARALVEMAGSPAAPSGVYTMVEQPEWTMREVVELYARQSGCSVQIVDAGGPTRASRLVALGSHVFRRLAGQKEMLTAHVVPAFPAVEAWVKGWYQQRRVAAELASEDMARAFFLPHVEGPVPGRRFPFNRASEDPVRGPVARAVRATIEHRLGSQSHNFQG